MYTYTCIHIYIRTVYMYMCIYIVATFYSTINGRPLDGFGYLLNPSSSDLSICCLAHSTDELFAFSSQERATKWYSPTLKVFQNGSDLRTQVKNVAWTRGSFFLHQQNHQSSLSWVANYETQAIRVNHLSALQNYLAELDTAPPARRPPEARRIPIFTFGPGERSVLGPRKKSSLHINTCKYWRKLYNII